MREYPISHLSNRAREYFAGDVQTAWIERRERGDYLVMQRPHYYPVRIAARVYAPNLRGAVVKFNAMARDDDRDHA